jgi:alpha-galactosidase
LRFTTAQDAPFGLLAARFGETEVAFPETLPAVHLTTADNGHSLASARLALTQLGERLRYANHQSREEQDHLALDVVLRCDEVEATLHLRSHRGVPALSSSVTVTALRPTTLRSVTSWSAGLGHAVSSDDLPHDWTAHSADADWLAEARWRTDPVDRLLPELANHHTGHRPRGRFQLVSTGTWSTGLHLPVLAISSAEQSLCWVCQVDHNGAWRIDLGREYRDLSLAASGPTDRDHGWSRALAVGESFTTVPASVALGVDFSSAIGSLTLHRRASRRPHPDNAAGPVIFNDYMNTLNGDPTTAKLLPLIDAAADVGAEIFCVDAGWYDETGYWWDSVGEWRPATTRFPGGFGEVIDRIRERGMVPGLWLEPEVIGVVSPLFDALPDEAFLQRHGQRIVEHDRAHLDLRHPAARAHLDDVVDRLVADFGVGYFKFDYNIDPGPGTDHASQSIGDGLLSHNRAHLAWLDGLLDRHPRLVIENCGSGGMRADFAMLSRLQLQSTSDQQEPSLYPPIAASAAAHMLPEQAASWAYPQPSMDAEEVAFCLATGLLGRFFLSGYLNEMSEQQLVLVREAVATAKALYPSISSGRPVWPLGLPGWSDDWIAYGLDTSVGVLLTVWKRGGCAPATLHLPQFRGGALDVSPVFPAAAEPWSSRWDPISGELRLDTGLPLSARVFRLAPRQQADKTDQPHIQ